MSGSIECVGYYTVNTCVAEDSLKGLIGTGLHLAVYKYGYCREIGQSKANLLTFYRCAVSNHLNLDIRCRYIGCFGSCICIFLNAVDKRKMYGLYILCRFRTQFILELILFKSDIYAYCSGFGLEFYPVSVFILSVERNIIEQYVAVTYNGILFTRDRICIIVECLHICIIVIIT